MNSNVLRIVVIPCDEPVLQQLVGAFALSTVFPFGWYVYELQILHSLGDCGMQGSSRRRGIMLIHVWTKMPVVFSVIHNRGCFAYESGWRMALDKVCEKTSQIFIPFCIDRHGYELRESL